MSAVSTPRLTSYAVRDQKLSSSWDSGPSGARIPSRALDRGNPRWSFFAQSGFCSRLLKSAAEGSSRMGRSEEVWGVDFIYGLRGFNEEALTPTPDNSMRQRLAAILPLALALITPAAVEAQAPFQLSLFPPVQIVPETQAVSGIRLGIYGKNTDMTGADLGLVTHTTGSATALQLAVVNIVEGDATGVQLGWMGGGAIANVVDGTFRGFQMGLYNGSGNNQAFQLGGLNNAKGRAAGLQFGLVNIANDMNGLQLGLINIIRSKENFPVLPLVNWKFDG